MTQGPRFYRVGGCVRDALLRGMGREVEAGDTDWVVVGATPELMVSMGFKPVGADFPVFLHPVTHQEYALARTERKTAHGYRGFAFYAAPDVTLEEDLRRRDLTVNAMAQEAGSDPGDADRVIDPYGGLADLRSKTLRHVSGAFVEDPVRVLRLARFAAKFPEFSVARQTMDLARRTVASGETDALVAERVFKELARGFAAQSPARMLEVLCACGWWQRSLGNVPVDGALAAALDRLACAPGHGTRAMALVFSRAGGGRDVRSVLRGLRADSATVELAALTARLLPAVIPARSPEELLEVVVQSDALRRPGRFADLLAIAAAVQPDFDPRPLRRALAAAAGVDGARIARGVAAGGNIAAALKQARLAAVRAETAAGGRRSDQAADQPADDHDQDRACNRNADAVLAQTEVDVAGQTPEAEFAQPGNERQEDHQRN